MFLIENDSIASVILLYYETIQPIFKTWRKFDEEMADDLDYSSVSKEYRKLDTEIGILKMNQQEIPKALYKKYIDVYSNEYIFLQFQVERQGSLETMSEVMDSIYSRSIRIKRNLESYLKEIE